MAICKDFLCNSWTRAGVRNRITSTERLHGRAGVGEPGPGLPPLTESCSVGVGGLLLFLIHIKKGVRVLIRACLGKTV